MRIIFGKSIVDCAVACVGFGNGFFLRIINIDREYRLVFLELVFSVIWTIFLGKNDAPSFSPSKG